MKNLRIKIRRSIILLLIILMGLTLVLLALTIEYPLVYRNIIVKYSEEYNIDPFLVASIINVESRYDKLALSSKGAKGLMQIGSQTGHWASEVLEIEDYDEKDLFEPDINIRIGTWYIDRLLREFNGNLDLVLAAYNAGSGNVNKWLEDERYCNDRQNLDKIPFKETENYLVKVKKDYKIYSTVYKKYLYNFEENDPFYINFLHNIRKILKTSIKI